MQSCFSQRPEGRNDGACHASVVTIPDKQKAPHFSFFTSQTGLQYGTQLPTLNNRQQLYVACKNTYTQ